jgi:hypothetical protein
MYFFTSITTNYISKARVLCKTLKKHNPEAKFILSFCDEMPEGLNLKNEIFDGIIKLEEIKEIANLNVFKFKYGITELCTAVKPLVAKQILIDYNADKVVYLDPDIVVLNSLSFLEEILDKYSMVFTPHQTEFETDDSYIISNEILFLKRGSMNLGFFGVKRDEEGLKFLNWWGTRLRDYCFDDNYETLIDLQKSGLLGMFTDQKWIDLVPSYFDNYYILKEPGYNVCTWNLTNRTVTKDKDNIFRVNNKPIFFFHFSGFDSGAHINELNKLCNINPQNIIVKELSVWYKEELKINDPEDFINIKFAFDKYSNGETIRNFERKIFLIRKDIHEYFLNPFEVNEGICFYNWVREEEYRHYFKKVNFFEPIKLIIFNLLKRIILFFFPPLTKRHLILEKIYIRLKK